MNNKQTTHHDNHLQLNHNDDMQMMMDKKGQEAIWINCPGCSCIEVRGEQVSILLPNNALSPLRLFLLVMLLLLLMDDLLLSTLPSLAWHSIATMTPTS